MRKIQIGELEEGIEVREGSRGVAAFFDLDGTLLAGPSLERRLFVELRYRRAIPARNCFFSMAEALRLVPQGIQRILEANKMYLRNVTADLVEAVVSRHAPRFYREGIDRVEWHARQGHAIYLLSGTLEGLASSAALALVARLAARGVQTRIGFCATRLEEVRGRWTGRIEGMAMFGKAKEHAARRIAKQEAFSLERSYAYGNSMSDRWMLAAVGQATAVNPSKELETVANAGGWPIMRWKEEEKSREGLTQRCRVRREEKEVANEVEEIVDKKATRRKRTEAMRLGSLG